MLNGHTRRGTGNKKNAPSPHIPSTMDNSTTNHSSGTTMSEVAGQLKFYRVKKGQFPNADNFDECFDEITEQDFMLDNTTETIAQGSSFEQIEAVIRRRQQQRPVPNI